MRINQIRALALPLLLAATTPAAAQTSAAPLINCGDVNAEPYFQGAVMERPCVDDGVRSYTARYHGLAYDILDIESQACFVPDSSYRLLDDLLADVMSQVRAAHLNTSRPTRDLALQISAITGNVLQAHGFGLHVPTRTLGDALETRGASPSNRPVHIFDCDIGSFILLTVAEQYRLPASLVEIDLSLIASHNYVRWVTGPGAYLDWDTNARQECKTPTRASSWQGRAMTRDEVLAYVYEMRGGTWVRIGLPRNAAPDYEHAMALAPARPIAYNEYAWLIATRLLPHRDNYRDQALAAAMHAVDVESHQGDRIVDRRANYLDTLACVYAYRGEFDQAADTERQAVAAAATPEQRQSFSDRRDQFTLHPAKWDCTGN